MRAYRCDACHKIFLLPDDNYDNDENVRSPAAEIYIYKKRGVANVAELCPDCLRSVLETIENIPIKEGIVGDIKKDCFRHVGAGGGGGSDE